jgi:sec-independent protein translocase protein TatA
MSIGPSMELAFISLPDIGIIFVVALLIFGPKRLPEVGRQAGQLLREFRKMTGEFTDIFHETRSDFREAVTITDPPAIPHDPHHGWNPEDEEGLMARSPRLSAPVGAQEISDERAERATGLVVSTVPRPSSEGDVL